MKQNKMKDSEIRLIKAINAEFYALSCLSNDDLRNRVQEIEHIIRLSPDKTKILDEYLPVAFAIVKETARRYSVGDIVVSVNPTDVKLASVCPDIVSIDGKQAIYHNTWSVSGKMHKWEMVHYDEQLLGGYYLQKGFAVQMATGEGKTLVATLPVFLNALSHLGVHIMTANDYLSYRDYELTRPIYLLYGLTVGCIEHSSRTVKKEIYKSDIIFGTTRSFTFDYLHDQTVMSLDECVQNSYNFAIIDECDTALIDEAVTPHILSGGFEHNNGKEYLKYKRLMEDLLGIDEGDKNVETSNKYFVVNKHQKTVYFTSEGKQFLINNTDVKHLFEFNKTYEIDGFDQLPKTTQEEHKYALFVQNLLTNLLKAYTLYTKDVDYIVCKNTSNVESIVIIDDNTGRPKRTSRWSHGLHTAVEAKESVPIQSDHESIAVISLKNYFKLYKKIAGMSGTITPIATELLDVYSVDAVVLPTHRPMIREDKPYRLFATKKEKDDALVEEIIHIHKTGRPILVGTPTILRAKEIAKILEGKGLSPNLLDATTLKHEAYFISKAGIENTITVATSIAGRGTDIKLSNTSFANGGLAVLCSDISDSIRIDNQLRGRSGRQGDPGSSEIFASMEDEIFQNLNKDDLSHLFELIKNTSCHNAEIQELCRKAQSIEEDNAYKKREKANSKDDTIAPHRDKFYKERKSLLSNSAFFENLTIDIDCIKTHNEEIGKNLDVIQRKMGILIKKELADTYKINPTIIIPCVYGDKTFVIRYLDDGTEINKEKLINEIKRQVLLLHYDEYWGIFVIHLMNDLDDKEVGELPSDFTKMLTFVSQDVANCLRGMSIPIQADDNTIDSIEDVPTCSASYNTEPSPLDLCPCGSGKTFSECHGKHVIRKRRR